MANDVRSDGKEGLTAAAGAMLDARRVREALGRISYPGLERDLVSFGMVKDVEICGAEVRVRLAIRTDDATIRERLRALISAQLQPIGATEVIVEIVRPALVLRCICTGCT